MTATIAPADLGRRLVQAAGELALLDVREQGVFARGHLLWASNLPLSRLELGLARLLPRRAAPIVLCDDDDGLARRAADKLAQFGYGDISLLDGGIPAWREAGLSLFKGVHVPSKAFGELVEARRDTPRITARELATLKRAGRKLVILDSRPLEEYRRMSIPGAINVPGAELVHRIRDLAPDPETLVVVNCAGRTRSIIGAQSLINAGTNHRVVALENGTMGWTLAGFELEHGQDRRAPSPGAEARAWAKSAAEQVGRRFAVARVDRATVERWREDQSRTTYLCDVRGPDEYRAGHLPGAMSSPGGQLVQATDGFIGVFGARIVLCDDDEVRAIMTGSWLKQMGHDDVHVLAGGIGEVGLESGDEPVAVLGLSAAAHAFEIGLGRIIGMLPGRDMTVIDVATSRDYRAGHIPDSWFAIRSRAKDSVPRLPQAEMVVVTSPDGVLGHLAAPEFSPLLRAPVKVLAGGTKAWREAGLPMRDGAEHMADAEDDIYLLPYQHPPERVEQAMRDYLTWETGLLSKIERDGTARFRIPES